jgi:ABC-type sulfate transport system permease subunit
MKFLKTMLLLFQYTYYVTREADRPAERSLRISKARTVFVLALTEMFVLVTMYLLIARAIVGHPIPKPPLPFSISPVIASFTVAFVLCYTNVRIIGRDNRIQHYKEIFDAWDEGKRLRWKILLISIAVLSIAAFFVVGEVTQNGFDLQNWKY